MIIITVNITMLQVDLVLNICALQTKLYKKVKLKFHSRPVFSRRDLFSCYRNDLFVLYRHKAIVISTKAQSWAKRHIWWARSMSDYLKVFASFLPKFVLHFHNFIIAKASIQYILLFLKCTYTHTQNKKSALQKSQFN